MKNGIALFFLGTLLITACTYDSEEKLYPNTDCNTVDMSLSGDITPILDNYNCSGCHSAASNSGSVDLEGYAALKIWVDNGILLKSMQHNGASPMPKGGDKMNDCDIAKVEAWINQGALDN